MTRRKIISITYPLLEKRGYIYVLSTFSKFLIDDVKKFPEPIRIFKLGSTNDMTSRLKTYNTHLPTHTDLIFLQNMNYFQSMEKLIQKILRNYCKENKKYYHSEWFGCSYEIIENLILYLMEKMIEVPKYDIHFMKGGGKKPFLIGTIRNHSQKFYKHFGKYADNSTSSGTTVKLLDGAFHEDESTPNFKNYDEMLDYLDPIILKSNMQIHKDKNIKKDNKLFCSMEIIEKEFSEVISKLEKVKIKNKL